MRGTGRMTCKMARVKRLGRMDLSTKECIARGLSMGKASIFGAMGACTTATGTITRSVAMASTSGQMAASTLAPGRRTRCMVRAN